MKTAQKKILIVDRDLYSRELINMLLLRDWRTDVVGKVDDFVQARKFTEEHSGNVDAIIIANLSQQIMRISGNLFFQNEIPILFVGNHLLDIDVLNWILRNKNGSYVAKNDLEYSLAQAVILTIQKVFVSTPTIRKQIEIYRPNNHLPKITNLYRSNKLLLWPKTKQEIIEQEIIKQFVIYNFSRRIKQHLFCKSEVPRNYRTLKTKDCPAGYKSDQSATHHSFP